MLDVKALSESLLGTIKAFVDRSFAALTQRIDGVERRLDDLPTPRDGHTPTAEELQAVAGAALAKAWQEAYRGEVLGELKTAVEALPKPADGHTPTVEELQPLVAAAVAPVLENADAVLQGASQALKDIQESTGEVLKGVPDLVATSVAKAVADIEIPKPADGHTPTVEELQPLVDASVAKAVGAIPAAKDGHTPTAEELQPLVEAAVGKAVGALPVAKDGHTPTAEELQPLVEAAVGKAVASIELPTAKDGHTPTAEELQPLVDASVAKAVEGIEIPRPADGHTPTAEELQPLVDASVAKAVAALPKAVDGHTPTAEELQPLVKACVDEVARALPKPVDGHTPTAEELQPLVDASVAKAVAALPKAVDGAPGRDALDLHILPAIDTEKSYPRSTYAKHLGGLWRSYEPTSGMRGWECIVEGIASLQVEQQGDRKFVVIMALSSGAQQVKDFNVPVMIYRGVYREGVPYEAGDTVTWGGSTWTCKQATEAKPGEGVADWQLAVKKGRDAKPVEGVKL